MIEMPWRSTVRPTSSRVPKPTAFLAGALVSLSLASARLEALVITEVMYNPGETPDERPFEFIELYNENADPLDLSGFTVCNGVEFVIPDGTWLEGKSFLVICASRTNIQAKYGITNILGDWFTNPASPSLSNGGERIEICNPGGRTVVEVQYNDRGKWPSGADGTGHSIEIESPFAEVDDPDSWVLSNDTGGSPGVANPCWDVTVAPPPPGGGGPVGSFTDHIDVGLPCGTGDTTFNTTSQRYTVVGAGNDIWQGGDQFQYAYVKVNGNFDMRARFVSRTWGPSQWGKGGIMARQDLTSSSRYVFVHDNPEPDAARIATRATHGGADNAEPVILPSGSHPAWLRLARVGNTITGYHSANGSTWTQFETFTFNWTGGSIVHLGLALTSHSNCDTATLVFDQVTITGTILPPDDPDPGPGPGPEPGVCTERVPVRLSEAYLRVNGGEDRWIELENRGTGAVNLGGYYLTNEAANLTKFQIPSASIPGQGFLTYTEAQLGFSLQVAPPGEDGDRLFIALVEPGGRVVDAFNFEPEFEGYSEARVDGDDRAFSPAADPTRGAANQVSVTTDIVINEVMYHPIDNDDRKEYVELYNRGPVALDLTGYAMSDGINFAIPDGTVIASGDYLVIARDPVLIRNIYGLPAGKVLGPENTPEALDAFGRLRDQGERLTLTDPLGRTVDTIRVHDGGEWPRWADGLGSSVELIDANQDNRRGQAWDASDDSAKATTQAFSYVARHGNRESEIAILLLSRGITLVDDFQLIGGGVTNVDTVLLENNLVWRYFKGTQEPPANWTTLGFNDGTWLSGQTGIGYGDNDDATVLTDMQDGYMTIFCRRTFNVPDRTAIDQLILNLVIDDGFYAYLNGTLVASNNVTSPAFDSAAPSAIEPAAADYDITAFKNVLVNGTNVLAVQVHNAGTASSDVSFIPRLIDRTTTVGGGSNLITNGTFNSNTAGWTLDGTHVRSGRTTVSPLTGAGSLKVIASGRGDNKMNRIETIDGTGLGAMTANQDVQISFNARWVVGSQTLLTHGFDHELARTHRLEAPLDLGTPGARNSVTQRQIAVTGGNLGPVITDVSQDPIVPSAAQSVKVRAKISDADGVASATLRYSLNDASASPASVAMAHIGDGDYEGTIPAQVLGTKVVFFIQATDSGGRPGRYPVDVASRTHPLVLNPPSVGLNDQRYCIYRHTVKDPATNFHNYRFFMTNASEQVLDARNRLSNDLVDGSFLFASSDIYYESSCRFAGSPWARSKWGSMRVRMPRDNPLHGILERVHLEDHHGNAVNANERISHYLIRQQNQGGVTVPYSDLFVLARWQVNDRIGAVREHVWVPDGDFLQRWYPGDDEGDFIEMDDRFLIDDAGNRSNSADGRVLHPPPYGTNDSNGSNKENYRWFFGLRAKNGADEYANFIGFARVMDPARTSDALFDQQIGDFANVEEMLRIWAVQLNIDDWDSWGASRGKNLYFYRPDATGLWEILAWDLELTYGNVDAFLIPTSPTSAYNPGAFGEVNRMFNRPKIKRMYYSILDEMVNGSSRWFHSSYLNAYAGRLATLGMANTGTAQPGGYIDQRASRLQTNISSIVYPTVRLQITSPNGGNNFSTPAVTANFAGTAPTEICEIAVERNGEQELYPVTYTSMTNWTLNGVPLAPGANALTLIGFDLRGNPIDSDTITITSTSTWDAPIIDLLDPESAAPGTTIEILGSDIHNGVRVFFGGLESTNVTFNEADPPPQRIVARVPSGSGTVNVMVRNLDLQMSNPLSFTYIAPPPTFIRGDANGDLVIDISDGVKVLRHLYAGVTIDCQDALDVDDNETLNVTDAIRILNYVVQNGPAPSPPFPTAGTDPAGTDLGCNR
jgi:hypothetical protein